MKEINYESSNYEHKDELKEFITSLNDLMDKFKKGFDGRNSQLVRIKANIAKKNVSLTKLESTHSELEQRAIELDELKSATEASIRELEDKKDSINYTDSEVLKMEKDDIDTLISSKKNKITKIETKIASTNEKTKANEAAQITCKNELDLLSIECKNAEDSLEKTEKILDVITASKEDINQRIDEIINEKYEEVILEDYEETYEDNYEEDAVNITPDYLNEENVPEDVVIEDNEEPVEIEEAEELNYANILEDMFTKENVNYYDFDEDSRKKMEEDYERTLKNIVVLKSHHIPLELTIKQPEIYYAINSQDLEDLLNIITTDSDGNGMGFGIDYTYYILNELAHTDVDKLIEVYNQDFMNVNSKSGLIDLVKKANPESGEFENNKEANLKVLNNLGVTTIEDIEKTYPDFVNLDNPLFLSALNLFDKNDLVDKLNSDIKIIPKIIEYWKNN